MKAASIFRGLWKTAKHQSIDSKNSKFLSELFELVIYRVDKEKSIEWTPKNITNFFIFLLEQPKLINSFQEETIQGIIYNTDIFSDSFNIIELSTVVYIYSKLFPENHKNLRVKLIERLNKETNFKYLDLKSFSFVLKGIFSLPFNINRQNFKNTLPDSLQNMQIQLIDKIKLSNLSECEAYSIASSIEYAAEEFKNPILEALGDIIYKSINVELDQLEDYQLFETILNTCYALFYFNNSDSTKELFRIFINRIFLKNFIRSQKRFLALDEQFKIDFLRIYLQLAEKFNLYQVVFLDAVVQILNEEITNKYIRTNSNLLSECLTSLAYLNYPARFNIKTPHKPVQWIAWQTFLGKMEDFILASVYSNPEQTTEEEIVTNSISTSLKNINFLWSLCAFDIYSKGILQILSSNIDPDENYSENSYRKLFQIHYWLKSENFGEFSFDNKLLEKMNLFKAQWDNDVHEEKEYSEMKNIVKNTMIADNYSFKENVHDFPYSFDFSHTSKKFGIIVDDDDQFLEETQLQIRSGYHKIMSRQLVNLGWAVKKISIRNWLNISNSDILPR